MVAVLYRKEPHVLEEEASVLYPDAGTEGPLSPGLIYHKVTDPEMAMWKEWLPTEIKIDGKAVYAIRTHLERLHAPAEVVGEFNWASAMQMFDEYMLRTPERSDKRDPLLLGRAEDAWYRLALRGESLLPIDQIRALVDKSLVVGRRIARRHSWYRWGSVILATATILASAGVTLTGYGNAVLLGIVAAVVVIGCGAMPEATLTPENAKQNFLDRYRL